MTKVKHERTADCVVAGYRVHKSGPDAVGSLLLGLHDARGVLVSVGVVGAFPMARRRELMTELQPLVTDFDDHPWAWAKQLEGERTPRKSETSRWNAGKDLSFVPLRPERVNSQGLAMTSCEPLRARPLISNGAGWPLNLRRSGLGSNMSMWLGPPESQKRMTFVLLLACPAAAASACC